MTCIMTFLITLILYDYRYVIIVTPYTPIIIMILERSQFNYDTKIFI